MKNLMKLGNKNNLYVLQNTYKFILQIIICINIEI